MKSKEVYTFLNDFKRVDITTTDKNQNKKGEE